MFTPFRLPALLPCLYQEGRINMRIFLSFLTIFFAYVQTADAQLSVPSKLVKVTQSTVTAVSTGTGTMPSGSAPTSTDGNQILSISPPACTSTSNLYYITFTVNLSTTASSGTYLACTLFRNSTNFGTWATTNATNTRIYQITGNLPFTCNSAANTFTVRCGGDGAGTTTFNGVSGAAIFGSLTSAITMMEYKP